MQFKEPNYTKSESGVSISSNSVTSLLEGIDYPVFCFKHIHPEYSLALCADASEKKFSKGFIKKLEMISKMSWNDIKLAPRQGSGTEKIPRNAICAPIPSQITDDVNDFLSLRFAGDNGRIIGFQNQTIFHIVYIDIKLSAYKH